jgi:hypothetical protein
MKQIEITEVKVKALNSRQDHSGEYETNCDIDFMLSEPISFRVFNQEHTIDRINMGVMWDEVVLVYAQEGKTFCCFPVSKIFVHKIYNRVIEEQCDGALEGWSFDDGIFENLRGANSMSSCYY